MFRLATAGLTLIVTLWRDGGGHTNLLNMESDEIRPSSLPKPSTESSSSQSDAVDDVMQRMGHVIQPSPNSFLEVAMDYINNHLRVFRTIPWVMGGVGALLVARYSGLVRSSLNLLSPSPSSFHSVLQFTRYHSAMDIPSHLLAHNATLRGVAAGVKPDCCLDVWHVPPGRRWLRWGHRPPGKTDRE